MKLVVGIDVGLHGGVAIGTSKMIIYHKMPVIEKFLDISTLTKMIEDVHVDKKVIYIEQATAMPKQGVVSMFNFGRSFGQLLGMCQAKGWEYQIVNSRKWKNVVLKEYATKDKKASLNHTNNVHRIDTKHDGIADAVCILEYGLIKEGLYE